MNLYHHSPNPNPNHIAIGRNKNNSGIKTLTFTPHALRVVLNATLVGLHDPFSSPNAFPKRIGLDEGLHNHDRVVLVTDSKDQTKNNIFRFEPKTYLH